MLRLVRCAEADNLEDEAGMVPIPAAPDLAATAAAVSEAEYRLAMVREAQALVAKSDVTQLESNARTLALIHLRAQIQDEARRQALAKRAALLSRAAAARQAWHDGYTAHP